MLNDRRLLKCADMVSEKGTVCDIGTDHAYLPVYLVENHICEKAVAGDIADGPLEAARATVEKSGLEDKITVVKSNGLKDIPQHDEISDVVIAGMGAETISEIIGCADWLKSGVNIILQPMTKVPFLRRWLYDNGFEIVKEEAVYEGEFIYTVMNVRYSGYRIDINDTFENLGMFDFSDENSVKYAEAQINRLGAMAEGMKKSEKCSEQDISRIEKICSKISKIISGTNKITVGEIYDEIDRISPFCTQESWDNSGLLIGDRKNEVTKILTALDITNEVIDEAIAKKADLIVSHHPIIFRPLKNLSAKDPAARLIANGISAICVHTPLDIAVNGINDMIADKLSREFKFKDLRMPIIPLKNGINAGDGRICELDEEITADEMVSRLSKIFGCRCIRYVSSSEPIRKLAICSGSGGSFLDDVEMSGCNAYITGDIKHDVWISAKQKNISLFDCGHYYTEKLSAEYMALFLKTAAPNAEVSVSEADTDIVSYYF